MTSIIYIKKQVEKQTRIKIIVFTVEVILGFAGAV